jgi:hypothetical protein
MTTTQEGSLWLANAEELTALECSTLMGGGFWCDVGSWFADVWEWSGRFFDSLDRQLAGSNYNHEVLLPDRSTIAGALITAYENQGNQFANGQDVVDFALDTWVVGAGFNTLEWWGEAVGQAAGEATYGPPGG